MCERALGTDVVASISGLAGSAATSGGAGQFRGSAAATFLLLYLAPPCPVKVPAMGQTEGVTETLAHRCRRWAAGTPEAVLQEAHHAFPTVSYSSYSCVPQATSQGQRQARIVFSLMAIGKILV